MEPVISMADDTDILEHLYNHKQICEALLNEGSRVAKALFHGKINHLYTSQSEPPSVEFAYILLTSLNRSLYNFFVMQLNLSFTECCFKNRAHIYDVSGIDALLTSGYMIIDSYAECLDSSRANQSLIEKTCNYIMTHLGDDLSLAKVSAEVYLSKSYLSHIFKQLTGETFNDYVRKQRIHRARTLLTSTDMAIDDIASACGFNSSTYFATVFKTEMGISPTAFRQENIP